MLRIPGHSLSEALSFAKRLGEPVAVMVRCRWRSNPPDDPVSFEPFKVWPEGRASVMTWHEWHKTC
jgi:hypothetical protein